jgi:LmbE family N-acetylglucosaminyl deacetylase
MIKTKTILAIGAHPDDIEIGCAGTLLSFSKLGANIYFIIASLGEQCKVKDSHNLSLSDIRKKESSSAAKIIGVKEITYLMLPDTFIEHNGETVNNIEEIINLIKPDLIFTHTLEDKHQDHKNLGYATISASRRIKSNILHYETPSTAQSFKPVVYSDITHNINKKVKILKLFSTQNEKIFLDNEAIVGLARYRGYTSGSKYAEAFEISKLFL